MAAIKLDMDATQAMVKSACDYGEKNKILPHEMGLAMVLAGSTLLSRGMNNVQLEEIYRQVSEMTAPLRKSNAS
jgi:hypothetical protein